MLPAVASLATTPSGHRCGVSGRKRAGLLSGRARVGAGLAGACVSLALCCSERPRLRRNRRRCVCKGERLEVEGGTEPSEVVSQRPQRPLRVLKTGAVKGKLRKSLSLMSSFLSLLRECGDGSNAALAARCWILYVSSPNAFFPLTFHLEAPLQVFMVKLSRHLNLNFT